MFEYTTIIELGALLGAISVAHITANSFDRMGSIDRPVDAWIGSFVFAPLFGGIWGAAVAAIIHFAVSSVSQTF